MLFIFSDMTLKIYKNQPEKWILMHCLLYATYVHQDHQDWVLNGMSDDYKDYWYVKALHTCAGQV